MFIGREKELQLIENEINSDRKSVILLYGRRRIGKTTLIAEALKSHEKEAIKCTAIPDELSENIARFSLEVGKVFDIPGLSFKTIDSFFSFLKSRKEKIILSIDEYQDLKIEEKGEVIDALFRDFIDSMPDNITLILSGSSIRMMKDLTDEKNPLYGRFSTIINLRELNYIESSRFYPEKSIREKIEFYSVFGGIPMILSYINKSASLEENIMSLLVNPNGKARSYIEDVLLGEISGLSNGYPVISRIGNGKRKYSEILSALNNEKTRNTLDRTLKQLQYNELIDKKAPINCQMQRNRVYYELRTHLLRFYLEYFTSSQGYSLAWYKKYIAPSLNTFISYRFEEIARSYFELLSEKGVRDDIVNIGTYWYDNPKEKMNGEFDVALETLSGYEIYETKFLKDKMSATLAMEEIDKIRKIPYLQLTKIGLISLEGFEDKIDGIVEISGEDLFSSNLQ